MFTLLYSLLDIKEFYHNQELEEGHTNFSLYNVFHKLYFSLITTSTIGYGDITPKSTRARAIMCIHILCIIYITFN